MGIQVGPYLWLLNPNNPAILKYAHLCPGCKEKHLFHVKDDANAHPRWFFNGNVEKPSFHPSMNINASHPEFQCHYFLTDGKLHFQSDCWHDLKGQIVDCPLWDMNGFP